MNLDALSDDARLVQLGVQGDRDAFGRLVARYQSPVCALAYSACGNIPQSEDVAQETFIIAWRKLADLKEPEKFRSWLFGIARNLINNILRKQTRNPLSAAEPLDESSGVPAPVPSPAGHAISREEEEILWRALEKIPGNYREALVLFYREQQSIEQVAATLELSQEAARQRLSRGRKLLQEQVLAFVEGALARTNPGQAFTLAVLAALPVTLTTSAKAATVAAAAAKGGAAASGMTFVSVLSLWLGPAIGLIAGYLGLRANLRASRTPRERKMMIRFNIAIWVAVAALFVAVPIITRLATRHWSKHPVSVVVLSFAVVLAYVVFVCVTSFTFSKRFQRLRLVERELHPELFSASKGPFWMSGRIEEYRSRATLFGLPLVHYRMGNSPGQKLRPAVGWIAFGNVAIGVLYASGGVAIGTVSIGGASLGLISLGGVSIGLLTFGGLALGGVALGGAALGVIAFGGIAIGFIASGGFALGWHAALGGLAVAHELAVGGQAVGTHANDALARGFFKHYHWLGGSQPMMAFAPFASAIIFAGVVMIQTLGLVWWRRKVVGHILATDKKIKISGTYASNKTLRHHH